MPRPTRKRGRAVRWFQNLLLLAISLVLSLGVVEVALRAIGHRALYEIYSKPSLFWAYDPLLGWAHEPGARGRYVGPRPWPVEFSAEVSINSIGLRGPELPSSRREGRDRILFLGDSMVAAFEVAYDESYVARVGRRLTERLGRPVDVINAGVRGYGTDQSYLYYRERGRLLEPNLVVLQYSKNDPRDNMTLHEMRRPFGKPALRPESDGSLTLVNSPVPHYPICSEVSLTQDFEVKSVQSPFGRLLCRAQLALFDHSALFSLLTIVVPWDGKLLQRLYYVGNPHYRGKGNGTGRNPGLELTTHIMKELAREVAANNAEFVVIGEPQHLEYLQVEDLQRHGVVVRPIEALLGKSQVEVRWRHDSHYNPEGHRLVAEEMATWLETVLGNRQTARKAGS